MVFIMYVCLCHGVSTRKSNNWFWRKGNRYKADKEMHYALGSQCGKCVKMAKEILIETGAIEYSEAGQG